MRRTSVPTAYGPVGAGSSKTGNAQAMNPETANIPKTVET
jgi:hypothetical protein